MAASVPSVNPTRSLGTPPLAHPLIDEQTGKVTVPWAAWLNLLYVRVGQGANNNIQNAQAAAELASIGADQSGDITAAADELRDEVAGIVDTSEGRIAAIKGELANELAGIVDTSESRIAAVRDELRAQIAALVDGVSNQAFRDYSASQFEYDNGWNQQIVDAVSGVLPSQTGNADRLLSTNGTTVSWRGSFYQSAGLSTSYGTTGGVNTGGFNALMGAGSATWLLSGTSSGTFRAGIQALDAGGALRFYEGTNHFDFVAGAITFPGTLTAGNSTLGTIGSGAVTSSGNVIANGGTVRAAGAANTQFTLANSSNAQLWNFGYNAASTCAGVYNTTAGAWIVKYLDTTNQTTYLNTAASTSTTTGAVTFAGGIGVAGQVSSSTQALRAPSTVNAATYTVTATDSSLIFTTTACTVTLPSASTYSGRIIYVKNITATAIISATSNVAPLDSATAGTAILAATAGKFAMLQSNGTNWVTMMAN